MTNPGFAEKGKRLAILLKGYPRLSETFIAQEILEIEKSGFSVDIVSLRHPTDKYTHPVHDEISSTKYYLPEYLHHEPIRVLLGFASQLPRSGFWRSLAIFMRDLVRDFTLNRIRRFGQALVFAREYAGKADFFYVHFLHTPSSVARYASIMVGIPFAISAHAKDIWTIPDWEIIEKLKDCDWCVTCTASGHRKLQLLAQEPSRIHLVYHGIDLKRFPKSSVNQGSGKRDGSDQNNPVRLITVGRAVEKKGIDTLLFALSVLPENVCWQWTHIGGGPLKDSLENQAKQLGISANCRFLGALPQSEVLSAYRNSDLFVLPCRIDESGDRDGLPNVIVEAQSQGLAVISSNVSAIPEFLEDGVNGNLVEPDNPAMLAEKIVCLARDPKARQKLGNAGQSKVTKEYSHLRTIGTIVSLLERSLEKVAPR